MKAAPETVPNRNGIRYSASKEVEKSALTRAFARMQIIKSKAVQSGNGLKHIVRFFHRFLKHQVKLTYDSEILICNQNSSCYFILIDRQFVSREKRVRCFLQKNRTVSPAHDKFVNTRIIAWHVSCFQ